MKSITLCCLCIMFYLVVNNDVSCSADPVLQAEAPYMALVYYRSFESAQIPDESYAAVLVQPLMLLSGHCCGNNPGGKSGALVARLGAVRVTSDSKDNYEEQEQAITSKLNLQSESNSQLDDGLVALFVSEPFHLTPAVNVALLPSLPPASEQTCYLYQFLVAEGDLSRILQRQLVRPLDKTHCSSSTCFTSMFDVDRAVGGAVSCNGKAVALLRPVREEPALKTDGSTVLHCVDLLHWRNVTQCSNSACLNRIMENYGELALFDDTNATKASAPSTGPAGAVMTATLLLRLFI